MKLKPWLKYLVFFALIYSLILLRGYVDQLFLASYQRFEEPAYYYYLVISLLVNTCIGVLLGLEYFINELIKEGRWKINLPKLLLVGLPSLYFSMTNIGFISNPFLYEKLALPVLYLFKYGTGFVSFFQVILGYVIITSPYKYALESEKPPL